MSHLSHCKQEMILDLMLHRLNAAVRLGNSPNYVGNPVFSTYNGTSEMGEMILFSNSLGATGQYLQIEGRGTNSYIAICALQTIGY